MVPFWGVLMVEVEKPIKENELEYGVKLESKIRYGIQIIADINERTPSELEFYDIKVEEPDGNKRVNIVTGIGSVYSESSANKGRNLTYQLYATNAATDYVNLDFCKSNKLEITYTLSDI